MKVLVIGANGQLGSDLAGALKNHTVIPLTHSMLEIADKEAVQSALALHCPDVVINTSAYHKVDEVELNPERAFAVNATAVFHLASACQKTGAILVHMSSDYVFGGDLERQTPYTEKDLPAPLNVYGISKLSGEMLIPLAWNRYYIVRTAGLFGISGSSGKGGNFIETMLRKANMCEPIRVVGDQHTTPTSTVDLAAAIVRLMTTEQYGIYHITNEGSCTWYEYAMKIFELSGLHPDVMAVTSETFNTIARRPRYSVLAKAGIAAIGLPPMRHWTEALRDYLDLRQQVRR